MEKRVVSAAQRSLGTAWKDETAPHAFLMAPMGACISLCEGCVKGVCVCVCELPELLFVRAASPPLLEPRVGGHVSALPELLLVRAPTLPELLLVRAASPPLLEPHVGGHVSALPELLPVRAASPSLLEPRSDA